MLPHFGQGTEEDKALVLIASIDELSIANVLDASSSSVIVKVALSSEKVESVGSTLLIRMTTQEYGMIGY